LPRANLAPGIGTDDHILLAIRPEHVRFAADGIAGEIAAATFLGAHSHMRVAIAGRAQPVLVSGDAPPGPGSVCLNFPPDKLRGLANA
jgi:hypothetical protein